MACLPPKAAEALAVPLWEARQWLTGDAQADVSDVEGAEPGIDEARPGGREALRWRGAEDPQTRLVKARELGMRREGAAAHPGPGRGRLSFPLERALGLCRQPRGGAVMKLDRWLSRGRKRRIMFAAVVVAAAIVLAIVAIVRQPDPVKRAILLRRSGFT